MTPKNTKNTITGLLVSLQPIESLSLTTVKGRADVDGSDMPCPDAFLSYLKTLYAACKWLVVGLSINCDNTWTE